MYCDNVVVNSSSPLLNFFLIYCNITLSGLTHSIISHWQCLSFSIDSGTQNLQMEQTQICIPRGHRSEDSLWDFISLHWKHFFPHCHIHTHFTRDFSAPFGDGSDSLISLPFSVCERSTPVNSFLLLLHLR